MIKLERWRVFRGPLSGRYFVARCRYHDELDRWQVLGTKHDVTDDVRELIAAETLIRRGLEDT